MKQTIPNAGRHLVQSITCRAFILMTRSITSLQDALGRSFYGGDAVIFKVTFLQVAHVHWPFFFFHKRHSILHLYRKVTTYRQIMDTPNTVTKIENKTTSIKLLHNNYLYTCTNKQFWFDLENVFFYESFPSNWHNN